jgi:hypothetical protein
MIGSDTATMKIKKALSKLTATKGSPDKTVTTTARPPDALQDFKRTQAARTSLVTQATEMKSIHMAPAIPRTAEHGPTKPAIANGITKIGSQAKAIPRHRERRFESPSI